MLKVGLTGGIGSGKTTVSKVFADKNFTLRGIYQIYLLNEK